MLRVNLKKNQIGYEANKDTYLYSGHFFSNKYLKIIINLQEPKIFNEKVDVLFVLFFTEQNLDFLIKYLRLKTRYDHFQIFI